MNPAIVIGIVVLFGGVIGVMLYLQSKKRKEEERKRREKQERKRKEEEAKRELKREKEQAEAEAKTQRRIKAMKAESDAKLARLARDVQRREGERQRERTMRARQEERRENERRERDMRRRREREREEKEYQEKTRRRREQERRRENEWKARQAREERAAEDREMARRRARKAAEKARRAAQSQRRERPVSQARGGPPRFSTNGRCGPNHGGTRCHGAACCSPSGWCGGRKGQRSAWCVRGKGGAWGGRFDGPAMPVVGKKFGRPVRSNRVGKTNRGFKRIRGGHICNRVSNPYAQKRCFRKYRGRKAAKMIAKKARRGLRFKRAKKVGKTNRGMKSLGKLNFKVVNGVHPLNRHRAACRRNPPAHWCSRPMKKMARRI